MGMSFLFGYAGGITAQFNQISGKSYCVVEKCYNSGNIHGEHALGGIVGVFGGDTEQGSIIKCYSKGKIDNASKSGAILGYRIYEPNNGVLNNLYYLNTVGLGAIDGEDHEVNNIIGVADNLTSYEEFLIWIENK